MSSSGGVPQTEVGSQEYRPPDFGDESYWEAHYEQAAADGEEVYDWLVGWDQLRCLLEALLAHDPRRATLHLGVGNSALPEDMYDSGYKLQTAVDISQVVIGNMMERNRLTRPEIQWIVADCRDMAGALPSDAFPLVCDKSTLDALFCHDKHTLAILEFIKEAFRVTAPGGAFVSVSMHRPNNVLPWLRQRAFNWKVRAVPLDQDEEEESQAVCSSAASKRAGRERRHCHVYICAKQSNAAASLEEHWPPLFLRAREHPDSDISSDVDEDDEDESGEEGEHPAK